VAGGRLATEHLLAAGHATVWHVAGPEHWFDSEGRVQGWRAALADAGAEEPPLLRARDWSAAAGYEAGRLVSRMPEVTAVFAANDHLALGLFRALAERGRPVPSDVSVVGFDDVPEAAYLFPPLTTVRPDFDAVAQAGLAVLLDALESGTPAQATRTIPPQLVARASVAAPAR
jgi:DNA-binding LacI/PurR family transcriptional regulator